MLAIFEIGSRRRATAAAARGVCAAGDTHIAFERRDWDRLLSFVAARSEHMRAARPVGPVSSGRIPAAPENEPSAQSPDTDLSKTGERLAWGDSEAPPSSVLESSRGPFAARVLLIDDDPTTREEIRAMLAEIGLVVELVESAEQANARLTEAMFDAVVLDLHAHVALTLRLRAEPATRPAAVADPRARSLRSPLVPRRRRRVRERRRRLPSQAVPRVRARRTHLRPAASRTARAARFGRARRRERPVERQGGRLSVTESFPPPSIELDHLEGVRGARKLLAVGGGRGGVGKSLIAQNLAVYFAQLGKSVALVDCDPTGTNMHTQFGLPAAAHAPPFEGGPEELLEVAS